MPYQLDLSVRLTTYAILPLVDEVTDIITAVYHFLDGNVNYGAITLSLVFVPAVLLSIAHNFILPCNTNNSSSVVQAIGNTWFGLIAGLPFVNEAIRTWLILGWTSKGIFKSRELDLKRWSLLEALGESAPQYILQVTIILRDGTWDWKLIASIVVSFISIIRVVITYGVSKESWIGQKLLATTIVTIGTVPKLAVCALMLAYLRIYILFAMAINMIVMAIASWWLDVSKWKYFVSLLNFVVVASPVHLKLTAVQWIMFAFNLLSTAGIVAFCNPFAEDLPFIHGYFWWIFGGTLGGVCLLVIPLEWAAHNWLKEVWHIKPLPISYV